MTKQGNAKLSWYRVVRGAALPTYALLLTRNTLADIEAAGPTLTEMLARAYGMSQSRIADVLRQVQSINAETWDYEPRLALMPGQPLEP